MNFRPFIVTGKRFAAGTSDHGRYVDGASEDFSFTAGVQQPTPDDLELLEEGKRTSKTIVIFTTYSLRLATKTANADRVLWEGDWYEVAKLKPFKTMFPGNQKAICVKIENLKDIPVPA
jgi:hypothetical protein